MYEITSFKPFLNRPSMYSIIKIKSKINNRFITGIIGNCAMHPSMFYPCRGLLGLSQSAWFAAGVMVHHRWFDLTQTVWPAVSCRDSPQAARFAPGFHRSLEPMRLEAAAHKNPADKDLFQRFRL